MSIYLSLKGQKQGTITGGVTSGQFPGQILCMSLKFGMGNPAGANTFIATGKMVSRVLVVTKPIDRSSPLLYNACANNETISSFMASYVFDGSNAAKTVAKVELKGAVIQDWDQEAAQTGQGVETVSFSYTRCDLTWVEGGIMGSWDMSTLT